MVVGVGVVLVGAVWMRVNESMLRTRDVSDSRFGFGRGELLVGLDEGDVVTFDADTGIDDVRLLQLLSDESLRRLCADSGRFMLGDRSFFVTELGPERPIRLPVLLLRLRFEGGPDVPPPIRCALELRPVGGFGAK